MSYSQHARFYGKVHGAMDGRRWGYALTKALVGGMVLSFLLLASYGELARASVTASVQENCRATRIVDYSQPLREMAHVHRVEDSGRLPFAPRQVRMNVVGSGAQSGAHAVGFNLGLMRKAAGSPVNLNWHIDTELALVDRSGVVTRTLASGHHRVAKLSGDSRGLALSFRVGRPALYRVEVTFFDRHGWKLGRYAEYFRVLKRRADVRLKLSHRELQPGDILESRLENPGTTLLSFGEEFSIDRFVDGEWQVVPITPDGFIQIEIVISAGEAYVCRNMRLPSDIASGHYRLNKRVQVIGGAPRELVADFHVSA